MESYLDQLVFNSIRHLVIWNEKDEHLYKLVDLDLRPLLNCINIGTRELNLEEQFSGIPLYEEHWSKHVRPDANMIVRQHVRNVFEQVLKAYNLDHYDVIQKNAKIIPGKLTNANGPGKILHIKSVHELLSRIMTIIGELVATIRSSCGSSIPTSRWEHNQAFWDFRKNVFPVYTTMFGNFIEKVAFINGEENANAQYVLVPTSFVLQLGTVVRGYVTEDEELGNSLIRANFAPIRSMYIGGALLPVLKSWFQFQGVNRCWYPDGIVSQVLEACIDSCIEELRKDPNQEIIERLRERINENLKSLMIKQVYG